MQLSDDTILYELRSAGLGPENLFVANGRLYVSKHAGDFRANSTYELLPPQLADRTEALLSLASRLALPEYETIEAVDEEIAQFQEWEALYERLPTVLSRYGALSPTGEGNFYLIDDYYCSAQHKIECSSAAVVSDALIAEVQQELAVYSREWEVIFVYELSASRDIAVSVYKNRTLRREA